MHNAVGSYRGVHGESGAHADKAALQIQPLDVLDTRFWRPRSYIFLKTYC